LDWRGGRASFLSQWWYCYFSCQGVAHLFDYELYNTPVEALFYCIDDIINLFISSENSIKTSHRMPPPLHVCVMDSPALWTQRATCTVKFVKSFATWQHRFDVDSNILSCPLPLYDFASKRNLLVVVITFIKFHRNSCGICAKRKMPMLARGIRQEIGTSGWKHNSLHHPQLGRSHNNIRINNVGSYHIETRRLRGNLIEVLKKRFSRVLIILNIRIFFASTQVLDVEVTNLNFTCPSFNWISETFCFQSVIEEWNGWAYLRRY